MWVGFLIKARSSFQWFCGSAVLWLDPSQRRNKSSFRVVAGAAEKEDRFIGWKGATYKPVDVWGNDNDGAEVGGGCIVVRFGVHMPKCSSLDRKARRHRHRHNPSSLS